MSKWTFERVAALAVDPKALDRSRKLAKPSAWAELGAGDDGTAFGRCHGSRGAIYQASVSLEDGASSCDCPSRQSPCKHALGLLLLLVADPTRFGLDAETPAPDEGAPAGAGEDPADGARAHGAAADGERDDDALVEQLERATARLRGATDAADTTDPVGHGETLAAAIYEAMAAWRALAPGSPSAAMPLADAIDAIDARLLQLLGPLEGKRDEIHRRFLAYDPHDASATLGRLLPLLVKATNAQATERLKHLAATPPDPRLSRRLAALLEEMSVLRSESGKAFWGTAFVVLGNTPDARTLPLLRGLGREHRARCGVSTRGWIAAQVTQLKLRLERELSRDDPLPPALHSALDAFCAAASERGAATRPGGLDAEALRAAIYAAPDDDDARAVYADVLSQAGDPRGELVALQLERAASGGTRVGQRERALLDEHLEAWLGSLAPFVLRGGLRFERGFVAAARWNHKHDDDHARTLDDPSWATVHTLLGPAPADVALADVMRSLRVVEVDTDCLEALAASGRERRFSDVIVHGDGACAALADCADLLPALRSATLLGERGDPGLRDVEALQPLLGCPLGQRLQRLVVRGHSGQLGDLESALRPYERIGSVTLEPASIDDGGWSASFERQDPASASATPALALRFAYRTGRHGNGAIATLPDLLALVDPAPVVSVEVKASHAAGLLITPRLLERTRAQLDAFGDIALDLPPALRG